MLIPLFLPDAGRGMSGELIGLFNKRPFRRLVIVNITDKVVSQSQVNRSRILRKLDDEQTADHRVDMKGWQPVHVLGLPQSARQPAVPVLHFGRLHGSSRTLATAVRLERTVPPTREGRVSDVNRASTGSAPTECLSSRAQFIALRAITTLHASEGIRNDAVAKRLP